MKILSIILTVICIWGINSSSRNSSDLNSDMYIILMDRYGANTKFFQEEGKYNVPENARAEEIRIYRDNFNHPSFFLYLAHLPFQGHQTRHYSRKELSEMKLIYDKDLSYEDWANFAIKDKASFFMIFQDEYLHADRFILGFTIIAYQINIHTGAEE
ncbi:hypothetical protein [Mongoliitalea lutea]|uniref:Uncharacterized protein n=1 Tax=Mongoliitalea lutea TaxID=849756 RepID=A0A8J3CYL8_9BACT|nr:hypothetical protein [Mongoliitalea lutea]GHB45082.1 hypothetical protein GCM10008106_27540 [Mongoliitalea lutea]